MTSVTLNGVALNALQIDGMNVWSSGVTVIGDFAPVNVEDDSILGSTVFGTNDGGVLSTTTSDFSSKFSTDNTIVSYRNDPVISGSGAITATPTFNTTTGQASVEFNLLTNVGTGVYNKTYTFRVYATDENAESQDYAEWVVACEFTVTQGVVPQIAVAYGTDYTSTNPTQTSYEGEGDFYVKNGQWSVRFTEGDAPTTGYERISTSVSPSDVDVTVNVLALNTVTGDSTHEFTLRTIAPIDNHYVQSIEQVAAINKYGKSNIATWRIDNTFSVLQGVPNVLSNETSNSYTGASRLGSNTYNGGGAGNDGGANVSSTSKSFVGNFSGSPTSYRNSGTTSGSSNITATPTFNTATGQASVVFSLGTSAGVGTFSKTYTFRVYATNGVGESSSYSTWSVTCDFTVTQGAVPTTNNAYGASYTSVNPNQAVSQGNSKAITKSGSWSVRFNTGDAPTTSYTRTSWGVSSTTQNTSGYPTVNATGSTGSTAHEHVIDNFAIAGSYLEKTYEQVYATNKYGNSATLIWYVQTTFNVS